MEIRRGVKDLQKINRANDFLWQWWAILPAERAITYTAKDDVLSLYSLTGFLLHAYFSSSVTYRKWTNLGSIKIP